MPQTLDYCRQVYQGEFRFRSWNMLVFVLVFGMMSLAFGYAAVTTTVSSRISMAFRICYLVGFAFAAGLATFLLFSVINDRRQAFTVSTDGIAIHGKLTPWSRIAQLAAYGSPGSSRVIVFFRASKFGPPIKLLTTPPTSSKQYEELLTTLRKTLSALYPNLDRGGYVTESS
jgi:hypothetical protein